MQALFAYGQCKAANYNIGVAEIEEAFRSERDATQQQPAVSVRSNTEQAKAVFAEKVNNILLTESFIVSEEAQMEANNAFKNYIDNSETDLKRLKKNMVQDAESLSGYFLRVISLLIFWSELSKKEADKRQKLAPDKLLVGDFNLGQNRIIDFFRNASKIQEVLIKKGINRQEEEDIMKSWYKSIVKKDRIFSEYRRTANPTFDQDKAIVNYLIKQIIFGADVVLSYFEQKDMYWSENKPIARSLVSRSVRDIEASSTPNDFSLPDFSNNWEEDKAFFEKIFTTTVQHDREYSDIIASRIKNWEVDRLPNTDQVILKMAISEMINFKSIPVKVTINEYIELSKNYSTPKSKQFVNGILDVISNDLKNNGNLKKSGRGLLDNR